MGMDYGKIGRQFMDNPTRPGKMYDSGHGTLAGAMLAILQDASDLGYARYKKQMRLSVDQVIEKVINRREGWGGPQFSYTWLTVMFDDRHDPMPDHQERFEIDYDYGCGTYWCDRMKARFFNSAADEHENAGLDNFLPNEGDHGFNKFNDLTVDLVIKYGLLPGQRVLVRGEFDAWTSYEGEHDSDFTGTILYIEPMSLRSDHLAEILEEELWPFPAVFQRGSGKLLEINVQRVALEAL